jgi:anti-anti-sigma factor
MTSAMPDVHVITLGPPSEGHFDWDLETAVCHVQEVHGRHVILNLEHMTMMDSRWLGKLFLTYHHLQRRNIRMSVVCPNAQVREMLDYVNLSKILPVFHSLDQIAPGRSNADSIRGAF